MAGDLAAAVAEPDDDEEADSLGREFTRGWPLAATEPAWAGDSGEGVSSELFPLELLLRLVLLAKELPAWGSGDVFGMGNDCTRSCWLAKELPGGCCLCLEATTCCWCCCCLWIGDWYWWASCCMELAIDWPADDEQLGAVEEADEDDDEHDDEVEFALNCCCCCWSCWCHRLEEHQAELLAAPVVWA